MGWVKASDKPTDGFKLARIIGADKSFPAMFAPHVIAGADGKTYKKEDIEWFDVCEPSFTIEDMGKAYRDGMICGFERCGQGKSNTSYNKFMKYQYNINMD